MDEKVQLFYEWLVTNGCRFPKIKWPSCDTNSGIRGAIATDDISENEVMLEIPINLMLSEPQIFKDPLIGTIMKENETLLKGDLLLIVGIMHEFLKGSDSFYYPYFQIFPQSNSIIEWTDDELSELQDEILAAKSRQKELYLVKQYNYLLLKIFQKYPQCFIKNSDHNLNIVNGTSASTKNITSYDDSITNYTYDVFKFAWHIVMSRAFGKRLPFSALVPFADCLNHNNVATKYDYNVDNNGVFRLYPTANNKYFKGNEVFNSYGRRANDNLLLEYGFAMLYNEWDGCSVRMEINRSDPLFNQKLNCFYTHSICRHPVNTVLSRKSFPLEALSFLRIVLANDFELSYLEARKCSSQSLPIGLSRRHCSTNEGTAVLDPIIYNRIIVSIELELKVIENMLNRLHDIVTHRITTLESDLVMLGENNLLSLSDRCASAISYRVTMKTIIDINIERLTILYEFLKAVKTGQSTSTKFAIDLALCDLFDKVWYSSLAVQVSTNVKKYFTKSEDQIGIHHTFDYDDSTSQSQLKAYLQELLVECSRHFI